MAQMGIAKGRVVDQDGKPVPGVSITFDFLGELTRQFKTETNDKGRFTQVVNSGRYRITAAADGYKGVAMDERIPSGPATDLRVRQSSSESGERWDRYYELLESGWRDSLDDLKRYLEQGAERRLPPRGFVSK